MSSQCAACGRELPTNPNELENIVDCRYCPAMLCSDTCAAEHIERTHPDEAVPGALDDDRPR
jgi:hypothetical protein